ncbi:Di-heme cytochrome c peroxidase [Desulfosarcina variabilis str. Montpellier]
MVIRCILAFVAAIMFSVIGCGFKIDNSLSFDQQSEYVWQVPNGFPIPLVPADNPMTDNKVELGRQLFYDSRLSGDGSVSCAFCHQPSLAFTDGRSRAVGIQGNIHPRSAMSLANVAYNATLGWDDPSLTRLEDQMLIPLYNTQPPEMGAAGREAEILSRLKKDRDLRLLFHRAFPDDKYPVTMRNVIFALASFERTLISGNSPYDRWAYGADPDALNKDQRAGARLFFSKRLNCFRCHAGFNFSGPVKYTGSELPEARFHNTALYNEDGNGAYPRPNTGLHRHTGQGGDMGKFRAPTLRNIALTAPYMHDGSIPTLEAVLDHYAAGGRSRFNPQIVRFNSNTDPLMTGFKLSPVEKRQLIAFLNALTDQIFIQQALEQEVLNP